MRPSLMQLPASLAVFVLFPLVASSQELMTLHGHTGNVFNVSFSPDGKQILSGSQDGTARLWDTATGKQIRSFRGGMAAAFSPNGKFIATGNQDAAALFVYDTSTAKLVHTFPQLARHFAFAPDNRTLYSAGSNALLQSWNVRNKKMIGSLNVKQPIRSLALSPNGRTLLVGCKYGRVLIQNLRTGQVLRRPPHPSKAPSGRGHAIRVATFLDNRLVFTGCDDGFIRLWQIAGNSPPEMLVGNDGIVVALAVSPNRKLLLSSGQVIRLWNLKSKQVVAQFSGHTSAVHSLAFSPDGKRAVSGSVDTTIKIWKIK